MAERRSALTTVIEFRPGAHEPGLPTYHKVKLIFDTTVSGTYQIAVNGKKTAAITFTVGGTTHSTAIANALGTIGFTVTVAKVNEYEFTLEFQTADTWYKCDIYGGQYTLSNGQAAIYPITYGGQTFRLQADATAISYSETGENIDTTPVGNLHASKTETKRSMTIELSLYDVVGSWEYALFTGQVGLLTVYEEGKYTGKTMWGAVVLITDVSKTYPNGDKLELTVTAERQGAMIYPFDTIQ